MPTRTILAGGTVWLETGAREADVHIGADGRIEALLPREEAGGGPGAGEEPARRHPDAEVLDVGGCWVLPGVIDAHVHFRDPGLTAKEDFLTGSAAAAVGGVTTVLDMPNTLPPVANAAALAQKMEAVAGRSYVDYGLFAAATAAPGFDALLRDVEAVIAGGAIGIKVLLGPTTGNLSAPSWGELYQLLTAQAGRAVFVFHCEERSVIEVATARLAPEQGRTYAGLMRARPRFGEIFATEGVLRLAAETGARVHVAHVALAEAVEAIARAKTGGWPVTAETCPQYLFLSDEEYETVGDALKVLPPVRSARDRAAVWDGLASGALDFVATDHAPHEEAAGRRLIWEGNFGMAGVQTLLPLLVDAAIAGRCSMADVVRWTSSAPARAFGLHPRKGSLQPGADADIAVVDPRRTWQVEPGWWRSKSRNTPFWGWKGRGLPVLTLVRGQVVARNGRPEGVPVGRLLRPGDAGASAC